ncbi:Glycosyltransferase family 64 protein C4 [Ananas comosus]|uniref:Glycosyltransferase family 64 protein C4 n=1 Tax=Ananas comosus TaxID=4615 RepID=A0A199UQV4_ANACO|nr:Glycosyltransferase family 64 protein C4 [Ananas comosus]
MVMRMASASPSSFIFGRRASFRRLRQLLVGSAAGRIVRLLLCCSLLLSLLLISGGCRCRFSHLQPSPPLGEGYTVVINTWKRNDLLKQSVVHYASCVGVDSIHVVWSEPDPPADSLRDGLMQAVRSKSKLGQDVDIIFDINQEDSLNNRFKEIKDLRTDAIFSIDDDVLFPCASVEFAFSVWRSAPTTMVGFVPRMHWLDKSRSSTEQYKYGGWWSVWWTGTYSMVLSKAAFLHKQYLDLYTNHMPVYVRDYVAKNSLSYIGLWHLYCRNCEDIAMSILVANVTGAPPIWVKGRIFEIGSTGISSLGGHSAQRSQCLNVFAAIYGRMPLVATSMKAIDSRTSWFW